MGIYRSYSNSILLASHRGKTFNRKQWSFLSFLVALMTVYVMLSLFFTDYSSHRTTSRPSSTLPDSKNTFGQEFKGTSSPSLSLNGLFSSSPKHKFITPARVQHLHRTNQVVQDEESKSMVERAEYVAAWQAKVDALQNELKEMHEKIEKEENLEADIWKLRKELAELHRQRDPLMAHSSEDSIEMENGQIKGETATIIEKEEIETVTMNRLPSASAWCFGDHRDDRLCRFKNLCYLPRREAFVLPKGNMTTLRNIPQNRDGALIDLTSLKDHSAFYFDYNEIDPEHPAFHQQKVRYIEKPTFILSRFHPGNIMHTIHDDVLGLYHLLKEFAYNGPVSAGDPFALDHIIQFVDGHGVGDYADIFKYFTSNPILYRDSLEKDPDVITCYRDAIVGNSKQANWYHYGFSSPQGPIANKTVDGHQVREVADYIMQKAGFDLNDPFHLPSSSPKFDRQKVLSHLNNAIVNGLPNINKASQMAPKREEKENLQNPTLSQIKISSDPITSDDVNASAADLISSAADSTAFAADLTSSDIDKSHVISIFSRLKNRKLVNEVEVAKALSAKHQLPVVFVRMEELTFLEQVSILRRTKLALGMHGSILIMGMFLPRGASMIELYPYAVPSENYTPYRHMASLPGMDLSYAAWENKHPENSKAYPQNHFMYGGLGHLSQEEREKVLHTPTVPKHTCCTNPYWLFRIFQDTIGHVDELVTISTHLFNEQEVVAEKKLTAHVIDVEPSAVDSNSVICHFLADKTLKLTWDAPWNGAHPQGYSVWDHNSFREYLTTETSLTLSIDPTKVTQVWIRPKKDNWRGKYTARIKCVPPGVIDNIK